MRSQILKIHAKFWQSFAKYSYFIVVEICIRLFTQKLLRVCCFLNFFYTLHFTYNKFMFSFYIFLILKYPYVFIFSWKYRTLFLLISFLFLSAFISNFRFLSIVSYQWGMPWICYRHKPIRTSAYLLIWQFPRWKFAPKYYHTKEKSDILIYREQL